MMDRPYPSTLLPIPNPQGRRGRASEEHGMGLSSKDLDFLLETISPQVADKERLKQIVREDQEFRSRYVTDEKVFRRILNDEEILLKISPALFFEVLLRKTSRDLKAVSYTIEKTRTMRVPVFDAEEVAELLTSESILSYLADMLSSFSRIESYAISFREKKGVWKKIRFNDLDIFSLMQFCEAAEEGYRLTIYKRIADICLFVLGMFPDFAEREYRYPFSGHVRPQIRGKTRISPEAYEREGRKFYRLAAEHQTTRDTDLSDVFWALHGHFEKAKKPLNFIADHYLHYTRHGVFG
jgi:hypothetical protein